jgi:hypothetical protein
MSRAVSPELVLVDPDLARAERERLLESARLALFVAEARVATHAPDVPERRQWSEAVLPVVALTSLLANLVLAFIIVAHKLDRSSPPTAAPIWTSSVAAVATTTTTTPISSVPVVVEATGSPAERAAERHVFEWLSRTPAAALPKALVGAGRPGGPTVSVRCAARAQKSYRCILRVGRKRLRRTLLVEFPAPAEGGARIQWSPR